MTLPLGSRKTKTSRSRKCASLIASSRVMGRMATESLECDQVNFRGLGDRWKFVNDHRDRCCFRRVRPQLAIGFWRSFTVPFLASRWRFLLQPRVLYLSGLLFQMLKSLVDGGFHVARLGEPDDGAIARADCDFSFMAVFLDGQHYLGFEFVAQDFPDFVRPVSTVFADGRSDFVLPAGVFHVH